MVGGFSQAKPIDDTARELALSFKPQVEQQAARAFATYEPIDYKTQVRHCFVTCYFSSASVFWPKWVFFSFVRLDLRCLPLSSVVHTGCSWIKLRYSHQSGRRRNFAYCRCVFIFVDFCVSKKVLTFYFLSL